MRLADFQAFVEERLHIFHAEHKVEPKELSDAEQQINQSLPCSLRWLLQVHGYSAACGLDSLSLAVEATLRCRSSIHLPKHIVVLNDWNDAGVVYLDYLQVSENGEPSVIWSGTHNLYRVANGEAPDGDISSFSCYAEWVLHEAQREPAPGAA